MFVFSSKTLSLVNIYYDIIAYHDAPEPHHFSLLLGDKMAGQGARPDTCNLNRNVIEACIMYQYGVPGLIYHLAYCIMKMKGKFHLSIYSPRMPYSFITQQVS